MSPGKPHTPSQLQAEFDEALALALQGVVAAWFLDEPTTQALHAVAARAPNPPASLVEFARQEFAGMLDGTNADRAERESKERLMRMARELESP